MDSLIELTRLRRLVRNPGVAYLFLRANQPLRHGLLTHQKSAGHGLRGEPAYFSQGQRDMRLAAERRMAARKYETQPVIPEGGVVRLLENGSRVGFRAGEFTTLNLGA